MPKLIYTVSHVYSGDSESFSLPTPYSVYVLMVGNGFFLTSLFGVCPQTHNPNIIIAQILGDTSISDYLTFSITDRTHFSISVNGTTFEPIRLYQL